MRNIKKTVSLTIVLSLLMMFIPFFNSISYASSDIAQGKTSTVSSSLDGYPSSNANDGNSSTSWCASSGSMNQWWKADLGGNYDLTGTSITLSPANAAFKYRVEVSADDSNYTLMVNKTSGSYSGIQSDNFTASTVRYVRITFTDSSTGDWASLSNVNVFGTVAKDNNIAPSVTGRVVYHSYDSYGDGSSKLYIVNLGTKTLSTISSTWTNVSDPMNAVWSSDGKKLVFMGRDKLNGSWDLYSYTIGAVGNPTNLTNSSNNREEDPKFYPGSNTKIVFKSTYGGYYYIKTMDLTTKATKTIYSSTSMECSMPYYSADGKYIYFSGLAGDETDIYKIPAAGGTPVKVLGCADAGIKEYYPVTKDSTGFLYTRPETYDMIYFKNTQKDDVPQAMPFNYLNGEKIAADNSDACIVNSNYTIISSDRAGGAGNYDLYICDNSTGKVWSLNSYYNGVNTSKNELGSAYTSTIN